ncbi:nucleoside diphosphate kinase regulator [Pelagibacterium nitratireducens]|uniref:Nucleoside diphosphate kinase regulator n=1 Tax=Pelagibacterium nitratireducens TaxID=1046114 RepID=A0ABZ2I1U8_9HYPH
MSQTAMKWAALPRPVLGVDDHGKLMAMASAISGPMADIADQLIGELDRARVVAQAKLADTAVRMGSVVSFTTTDGFNRTYQLVFPGEADISSGRVSVLTPIGAALIGMGEGQTIAITARDGRELALTVTRVERRR